MKVLWNLFGGLIAFVLSILLVASLVLCPLVSFLTYSAEPVNLVRIVANYDFLKDSDESVAGFAVRLILPPEILMESAILPEGSQVDEKKLVDDLSKSDLIWALLSAYADDVMDAATGIEKAPALTKETVVDLLKPHASQMIEAVKDSLPAGTKIDEKKLAETINSTIEKDMPLLVEEFIPAQELAQSIVQALGLDGGAELHPFLKALKFIRTGKLRLVSFMLVAALALLILLFRLPKPTGLRWIGIAGMFSALPVGALSFGLQSRTVLSSLQQISGETAAPLVSEFASALAPIFLSFAIVYGIAGLALVIVGGVLRTASRHRH